MKRLLPILALLPLAAASASTTYTGTWNVSTVIPDNDDAGYTDTHNVSVVGITQIESVTVDLSFTGGWNGDLYAYLVHNSGIAVLLNRPGRSAGASFGAGSSGMIVTLDDNASADIHTAIRMSGGSVAGIFQPDGRTTDPLHVLDTDSRPARLSSFTGLDASGAWTLFVADQAAGDTSTLQSWSLTVTGVPEPSTASLILFGMTLGCVRRKRI